MKLLNKTSLYYFLCLIPVLLLSGVALFFFLQQKITDGIDDSLMIEKGRIARLFNDYHHVPSFLDIADNEIQIDSLPPGTTLRSRADLFTDTSIYNNLEEEVIPYRQLTSYFIAPGHVYRIILRKSYLETEDLIQGILLAISFVFIFLLAGMLIINRWIDRKLWNPFSKTLAILDHYDLEKGIAPVFEKTSVEEFKKLNENLAAMSKRIMTAYNEQKQFIENASHEIQTPLAVIRSKTDILLQSKNIREEEMEIIQGILNASAHLSQLNKTLLLLSKIENNQFDTSESVDVRELVEQTLEQYEDMITLKKIMVQKEYQSSLAFSMNRSLAEILMNNLFQNAIYHNLEGGKIFISVTAEGIAISNSGNPLSTPPEELFNRFKKDDAGSDSTGLGLAIVKQICLKYDLKVSYHFENGLHVINIMIWKLPYALKAIFRSSASLPISATSFSASSAVKKEHDAENRRGSDQSSAED